MTLAAVVLVCALAYLQLQVRIWLEQRHMFTVPETAVEFAAKAGKLAQLQPDYLAQLGEHLVRSDLQAADQLILAALVQKPTDARLWSRAATVKFHLGNMDLGYQAALQAMTYGGRTPSVLIEQAQNSSVFGEQAPDALRSQWALARVTAAQLWPQRLFSGILQKHSEDSFCRLMPQAPSTVYWCNKLTELKASCIGQAKRPKALLKICHKSGFL